MMKHSDDEIFWHPNVGKRGCSVHIFIKKCLTNIHHDFTIFSKTHQNSLKYKEPLLLLGKD